MYTYPAHALANAWLNVAAVALDDPKKPLLHKAICFETWPDRAQLVATDTYALLRQMVPAASRVDDVLDDLWPEDSELPPETWAICDADGIGANFMSKVAKLTAKHQDLELTIRVRSFEKDSKPALSEAHERKGASIIFGDSSITLPLVEFIRRNMWVDWRRLDLMREGEAVDGFTFSPYIFARIGKLRGVTSMGMEPLGDGHAIRLDGRNGPSGDTVVKGLIMPMGRNQGKKKRKAKKNEEAEASPVVVGQMTTDEVETPKPKGRKKPGA